MTKATALSRCMECESSSRVLAGDHANCTGFRNITERCRCSSALPSTACVLVKHFSLNDCPCIGVIQRSLQSAAEILYPINECKKRQLES